MSDYSAFEVHCAKQESLLSYLQREAKLLSEVSLPQPINNTRISSAASIKSTLFPLFNSHVYVGSVRNVILLKRKYLLTPDNSFIAEGLTHSDYFITWEGFDDSGLGLGKRLVQEDALISFTEAPLTETLDEPCIFIGGDTIVEPNFAHWFFEHLLKFRALQVSGVDLGLPIVVSSRIPNRFLRWAELLIGRPLRWVRLDLSKPLRLIDAVVCSCPAYRRKIDASPTLWSHGFDFLASHFIRASADVAVPAIRPRVVFIGRSGAKWRRAINEQELYEISNAMLGATKVEMAKLEPLEQVAIINSAEIIICFGGADGPVVNFCNPRARVIEICAPTHAAFYTSLVFCANRRIDYTRLVAERFVGNRIGPHPLDSDYVVNAHSFREIVSAL